MFYLVFDLNLHPRVNLSKPSGCVQARSDARAPSVFPGPSLQVRDLKSESRQFVRKERIAEAQLMCNSCATHISKRHVEIRAGARTRLKLAMQLARDRFALHAVWVRVRLWEFSALSPTFGISFHFGKKFRETPIKHNLDSSVKSPPQKKSFRDYK